MHDAELSLASALWPPGAFATYVVLDAAAAPAIFDWVINLSPVPAHSCLLPGELPDDLLRVAPHMLQMLPQTPFARWFLESWGRHWGIGIVVPNSVSVSVLHRHLSRHTRVMLPDGTGPAYFRFYDPRILAKYASEASAEALTQLLGPIEQFVIEATTEGKVAILRRAGIDSNVSATNSALSNPT